MEIKTYKKDAFYSYTLGAFPTIELLKKHKEEALKIFIHSSFDNQEIISFIYENKGNAEVTINDKMINKLSTKGNTFVVGIFKKYSSYLDENKDHVVLVNPSDMGNLGTIIRSCLGFGIKNIAIIKPGVDIFDPKVIRASMGSIFSLNISYFNSFEEYKNTFSNHRVRTFMLQAKNTLQETIFPKDEVTSLVFGNESSGLPISLLDDNSIIIKHSNEIDSLNLPSSLAIALYEFSKSKVTK
ncbi:MAG: TrmH family RNA methyltransferase [Bacilli bacterium]